MTHTYFTTTGVPYQIKHGLEDAEVVTNLSQTANCFNAYEVNPAIGCGFGCRYCSMYGQDEKETHFPVIIYKDYPEHLAKFINAQPDPTKLILNVSPKTDFFSTELIESGITARILEVFLDTGARFFSLTKGNLPPRNIQDLLIKTRGQNQIIISSGLPNVEIEKLLEPGAAPSPERMKFARFCRESGITTTGIIAPYLPLGKDEDAYRRSVLNRFKDAGISHCSLDVLKGSMPCIARIGDILPEYRENISKLYLLPSQREESAIDWRLIGGDVVTRYNANTNYVRETLLSFKQLAKEMNMTVSACVDTCKLIEILDYNREAKASGFNCVGYTNKTPSSCYIPA